MVEQNRSGVYTQIVYSPTGEKLAVMNGQTLVWAFLPLPGGATAVYNSSGLQYYRHSDWLGSSRLASKPDRTIHSGVAYAPFGEDYVATGTADFNFTGQNQDTVQGLYDFLFREYSPVQGRWISPDPLGLGAVNLSDPQSLNRYAYVFNSPLNSTDPLGLLTGPDGWGLSFNFAFFNAMIDRALNLLECRLQTQFGVPGGCSWGGQQVGGFSFGFSLTGGLGSGAGESLGFPSTFPLPMPTLEDLADFAPKAPRQCTWGPCPDDPQVGITTFASKNADNWWKNFAVSFLELSGDKRGKELCVGVFLRVAGEDLAPFNPSIITPIELGAPIAEQAQVGRALLYASKKKLTYPMKSSVFRSMISKSRVIGPAGQLIALNFALAHGLVAQWQAIQKGACSAGW